MILPLMIELGDKEPKLPVLEGTLRGLKVGQLCLIAVNRGRTKEWKVKGDFNFQTVQGRTAWFWEQ